eukprot:6129099-Pleurochrysis_carterae.AAC.1
MRCQQSVLKLFLLSLQPPLLHHLQSADRPAVRGVSVRMSTQRGDATLPAVSTLPSREKIDAHVVALYRFAVKGLASDTLQHVHLGHGDTFPYDRRWAMLYAKKNSTFDPQRPEWVHKENFLCAFTANELLGSFVTSFDDSTQQLTVRKRAQPDAQPLLQASLVEGDGRARVGAFFSEVSGAELRVVSSTSRPHQFGNTRAGVSASGDTRTIHIVNQNTVAAVSARAGVPLDASRFRANVVLGGALPAWREFEWVGRTVRLGSVTLRVLSRTVRCEGVNVAASGGAADVDVPRLLNRHFPEHGPYLGVYAQVIGEGDVRVGDTAAAIGDNVI